MNPEFPGATQPSMTASLAPPPEHDQSTRSLVPEEFEQEYYRTSCGPLPYERSAPWLHVFGHIADRITETLSPASVFDAGCAHGFLVEALRDRGVTAMGRDISAWANSQVREDIRQYCELGSITDPIGGRYDLVTCVEVLEHLEDPKARQAIENICRVTDTILFSSTPSDHSEKTHVNVRPVLDWIRLFSEHGFQPDLTYMANYVAPHAFLLRRSDQAYPDEAIQLFEQVIQYRIQDSEKRQRLERLDQALQANAASLDRLHSSFCDAATRIQNTEAELERHGDRNAQALAALTEQIEGLTAVCGGLDSRLGAAEQGAPHLAERLGLLEASTELLRLDASNLQHKTRESQRQVAEKARVLHKQVFRNTGSIESILSSRTWRALCWLGGIVLRLHRSVSPVFGRPRWPLGERDRSQGEVPLLICDFPSAEGTDRVRGMAVIQGWALTCNGIASLEVLVDGEERLPVERGIRRPDVMHSHGSYRDALHCGYQAMWDTSWVPDGPHEITVRATGRNGHYAELTRPVLVDLRTDYRVWIEQNEPDAVEKERMKLEVRNWVSQPKISIVVPLYKTPLQLLTKAVDSVKRQIYPNWELCLVDDGSDSPPLREKLAALRAEDSRVLVKALDQNRGIAEATNECIEMATGEYVGLLDHDDELADHALYEVVKAINANPELDLLYSDEDKIDLDGNRFEPFFKPRWSPELLRSCNYICHFLVCRRSLLVDVGRLRAGFEGSQDHDLLLRLSERTDRIHRIPRILYHWRAIGGSTAMGLEAKPQAAEAGRRAIAEHLVRTKTAGEVTEVGPARYRVRYEIKRPEKVTIVVPTGGNLPKLKPALQTIFKNTQYPDYGILVVDNSEGDSVVDLLRGFGGYGRKLGTLDRRGQPFNFSRLCNSAAEAAKTPYILFLNDDITAIHADWLAAMVEHAQQESVGAVGPLLLYPEDKIQHAGVVLGVFQNCGHAFTGFDADDPGYFGQAQVVRNVAAVTGACLLARRDLFLKLGGFNEKDLPIAFQDVDFCLRLWENGYRVVYTPFARLYHHESSSKNREQLIPSPAEVQYMQTKWAQWIEDDPFYNPNLTREKENFLIRLK